MANIRIADIADNTDLNPRQMQAVTGGVLDKATPKICSWKVEEGESWKVEEGESWKVEEGESFVPFHRLNMVQSFPVVL